MSPGRDRAVSVATVLLALAGGVVLLVCVLVLGLGLLLG